MSRVCLGEKKPSSLILTIRFKALISFGSFFGSSEATFHLAFEDFVSPSEIPTAVKSSLRNDDAYFPLAAPETTWRRHTLHKAHIDKAVSISRFTYGTSVSCAIYTFNKSTYHGFWQSKFWWESDIEVASRHAIVECLLLIDETGL